MANLINNLEKLKSSVSISGTFDFRKIESSVNRAERKFIKNLIGPAQYQALIDHDAVANPTAIVSQVKYLFEEAAGCYTMVLALPTLTTSVTNSGLSTTRSKDSAKAEWYEQRDQIRTYLQTATEAIDEALELMEQNINSFGAWATSRYFTIFNDSVVKHTRQFNEGYYIHNNRLTFLSLRPFMKEVEEQYLKPLLGDCFALVLDASVDPVILRAQELARLATISLTVAKVATTGTFLFTSTGMTVHFTELPWDKNAAVLSDDRLEELRCDRQNSGEEFLKKLQKHVRTNLTKFPCYQEKEVQGLGDRIIRKKSGLTL